MSDVITLSSDEEGGTLDGPRAKKFKISLLDKFTDITALPKEQTTVKASEKKANEDSIIFIIGGEDPPKRKPKNGVPNNLEVVVLTDEPSEEITSNSKVDKANTSNDCVVIDDVSDGGEHDESSADTTQQSQASSVLNGTSSSSSELNGIASSLPITECPSTSTASSESNILLEQFLEICANSLKDSRFESKLLGKYSKIRENFVKCESIHDDYNLKKMLMDEMEAAKISSAKAVLSFQRIYSYLMDHVVGQTIEVPEEHLARIKKLDKMCKLLVSKIKELGDQELDFDAEENSVYLQMDRYTQRLNKVYKKYCDLIKRNPYAGRLVYEKIQFVSSKYNEINRTLTKFYKQNNFPTYYDVEKRVKKCVSDNNLGLSEAEIKDESKHCFVKMGELLQLRRKKELYEALSTDVPLNEDPAAKDSELNIKLEKNFEDGDKKMKELINLYVKKQESNVPVEVSSSDSDDSNHKTSESDNEEI